MFNLPKSLGLQLTLLEMTSISGLNAGYLNSSLPLFRSAREVNFSVPYAAEQRDAHELTGGNFSCLQQPYVYD